MFYIKDIVGLSDLTNALKCDFSDEAICEIYDYVHQQRLDVDLREISLYFEVTDRVSEEDDVITELTDGRNLVVFEHSFNHGKLHLKREPTFHEFLDGFSGKDIRSFSHDGLKSLYEYLIHQASQVIEEDSEFNPDEILKYFDEVTLDSLQKHHTVLAEANNGRVVVDLFSKEIMD